MDFFARQTRAREQTRRLVALFLVCVIVVDVALTAALVLAYGIGMRDGALLLAPQHWLATHAQVVAACAVLILTVIVIGAAAKTLQLAGGGAFVARSMGADPILPDTSDPARRRLLNVVEEMAIASGVPVPRVYLMEHERGLNAFAAGHSPADSVVAVTRGTLERLDRDELQGVIGHEFSHILNGDMRLNMRLMGMVAGLFALATVGRLLLRGGSRSRKNGGGLMLVGLAFLVLGFLGYLAGRMIQAAISRQREFLADASSVQFTRDPAGLRDALVKIGALETGSRLDTGAAADVAHMLFAAGLSGAFATHPPLVERIRALDPSFQEDEFARVATRLAADTRPAIRPGAPAAASPAAAASIAVVPARVAALVGNPQLEHVLLAREIRTDAPDDLRQMTTQAGGAARVLLALTLDADAAVRAQQLQVLGAELGDAVARSTADSFAQVALLPPIQRLPMLQRIVPTLARLPRADRERMLQVIDAVASADGSIGISEYALARLARVHLTDQLDPRRDRDVLVVADVVRDLQTLLSALARFGNADRQVAERAYDRGMEVLVPVAHLPYAPTDPWIEPLDRALERLDRLTPAAKERLVEALVATISLDGRVTVEESELLRVVCATLHCPLPPFAAEGQA